MWMRAKTDKREKGGGEEGGNCRDFESRRRDKCRERGRERERERDRERERGRKNGMHADGGGDNGLMPTELGPMHGRETGNTSEVA